MAAHAATIWEFWDTGATTNAGGFNPSNASSNTTDYSQQANPQYNFTNLSATTATATPSIASASHNFVAADVGNFIHITAGSNWTAGIYEIISVAANRATLDRACASTASPTNGTFAVGGALLFGATDAHLTTAMTAGNTVWIKKGTYTLGAALSFPAGTATARTKIMGYKANRGDVCVGADRPDISFNTRQWTMGAENIVANIIGTGTVSGLIVISSRAKGVNLKITNNSGSANLRGINMATDGTIIDCEVISTLGIAVNISAAPGHASIIGCYIHDSDIGITYTLTAGVITILNCIIAKNTTAAINISGADAVILNIFGNTLFGTEAQAGVGLQLAAGILGGVNFLNNIVYGFVTGVSHATASNVTGYPDYNNFYNNGTPRTNWPTGANDIAVDPDFADTSTGDFRVGSALKALGLPSSFPGGLTAGYTDIGAAQRLEDYPAIDEVERNVVYSNGELTGTLTANPPNLSIFCPKVG